MSEAEQKLRTYLAVGSIGIFLFFFFFVDNFHATLLVGFIFLVLFLWNLSINSDEKRSKTNQPVLAYKIIRAVLALILIFSGLFWFIDSIHR